MQLRRKPRILIVTILLCTLSSSPIFTLQPALATSSGLTTLYFQDFLNIGDNIDIETLGIVPLLDTPSTKQNNSYYPPYLIDIIQDVNGKEEEFLLWFSYLSFSLLEDFIGQDIIDQTLGDYDIFIPNPLRIIGSYENTGTESQKINGNVEFSLDFISNIGSRIQQQDEVTVSLYQMDQSIPIPSLIKESTTSITQKPFSKISTQTIIMNLVNTTIDPGDILLFSIEIIPANKTLTTLLTRENTVIQSITDKLIDVFMNIASKSTKPEIQNVVSLFEELQNVTKELNLTKSDIASFINALLSPSLVYNSVNHEASVTIPFSSFSDYETNIIYYLDEEDNLNENAPSDMYKTVSLIDAPQTWSSSSFSRSKVLTAASAMLYLSVKDYNILEPTMDIEVSLLYDSEAIASDIISLEKTKSLTISPSMYFITFDINQDQEITYGKQVGLQLELLNNSEIKQGLLRSVDLLYDGSAYQSALSLSMTETDHISVTSSSYPDNGLIIPGKSVIYNLTVTSEFQDDLTIRKKSSKNEQGFWNVVINPTQLLTQGNSENLIQVTLTSTQNTLQAYKQNPLEVKVEIIGNTGYTTSILTAEVSEEAVNYNTLVSRPKKVDIKQGDNHTFVFEVTNNNSGLWNDSYIFTASSTQNFSVAVSPLFYNELEVTKSTLVNVTVYVPEDIDIDSDTLLFQVISKNEQGEKINRTINYTITKDQISAEIFSFFESLAKDLGFDESFGDFAPYVIPILLIIIIFIILIIMVFILTSRSIKVSCAEKKQEIFPQDTATFSIQIKNRSSKKQVIDMNITQTGDTEKWNITHPSSPVIVFPKEEKNVDIQVQSSDIIEPNDKTYIDVLLSTQQQKKPIILSLETMIKDGESSLFIEDVSHWPKDFSTDERVITSFKLWNKGSIKTKHIKIKMFINGKEKNKVEDIIIPARGYAEIKIPWIVEKGKNKMSLIVS